MSGRENRHRAESSYWSGGCHSPREGGSVQARERTADASLRRVSNDGYSPPAYALAEFQKANRLVNWRRHWWLNVVLLVATLLTTTVYGTAAAACYAGQPFQSDLIWAGYGLLARGSPAVLHGLIFSVPPSFDPAGA